jgi:hypothetical protein
MTNAKILSTEEVLDCPVTAFPFSPRALEILKKQDVHTMRDLVDTDAKAWLFSFRCDRKTLGEMVALLKMLGFTMQYSDKVFTDEAIGGHVAAIYESFA